MITAILLLAGAASTGIEVPQCPPELSNEAVQVRPAPGWTGVTPSRVLLSNAGLVIGRPDVDPRAELRGDARQRGKHITETTYPGLGSQEKWLICSYGQGGELEQAYRLPNAVESCVIRVTRSEHNNTEVLVKCSNGAPIAKP